MRRWVLVGYGVCVLLGRWALEAGCAGNILPWFAASVAFDAY